MQKTKYDIYGFNITNLFSSLVETYLISVSLYLQLFASTTSRTVFANYRFTERKGFHDLCGKMRKPGKTKSTSTVIENIEMVEIFRSKLNLHHDVGTLLQSKQVLTLRGKFGQIYL